MLTTKKFIKEVKAMGLVAIAGDGYILVKNSEGCNVAYIKTKLMYTFDTVNDSFQKLSELDRKRLFNLLVEYASTPINERKEPLKFYLKFKIESPNLRHYLNYDDYYNSISLNTRNNLNGYQTQFTQKEIDKIKEKFGVTLSDFEQLPVDEYWWQK